MVVQVGQSRLTMTTRPSGSSTAGSGSTRGTLRQERQDALVHLVRLLELEEVTGTFDDGHLGSGRQERLHALGQLDADAAVRRAVEIEGRLRRGRGAGGLRLGDRGRRRV